MGIRFACHHCGRRLNIKDDLAGKRGVCPECKGRFRIPNGDAEFSEVLVEESSGAEEASELKGSADPNDPSPDAGDIPANDAKPGAPKSRDRGPKIALLDQEEQGTWYVRPETGGQFGPADASTLRQWILQGRVSKTSLVWREGWAQWRDAQDAFADALVHLPDAPPVPHRSPEQRDDSLSAGEDSSPFDSTPLDAEPAPLLFEGGSQIGTVRRQRHSQRITSTGVLAGICLGLLAILGYLIFR